MSHLTHEEGLLLNRRLTSALTPADAKEAWSANQKVIGQLLIRMGTENAKLDAFARAVLVRTYGGFRARIALIPVVGRSAIHLVEKYGLGQLVYRMAGEFSLMELSAAAGYRTFCLPELIRGLLKTGKMKDRSVERMIDTFEFLKTMFEHPYDDSKVLAQLNRTNGLHGRYKVAGAADREAQDLFKYIALNMFYMGPAMRPDLSPHERHALCSQTVLVASRMGHTIEGSALELEQFIVQYEASHMFARDDRGVLRRRAVEIARASKQALNHIPTISPARIHGYVPHGVKKILEIDDE